MADHSAPPKWPQGPPIWEREHITQSQYARLPWPVKRRLVRKHQGIGKARALLLHLWHCSTWNIYRKRLYSRPGYSRLFNAWCQENAARHSIWWAYPGAHIDNLDSAYRRSGGPHLRRDHPEGDAPPHLRSAWHRLALLIRGRWKCARRGHDLFVIDGGSQAIVYQKGEVRPARVYFSGRLYKCRRCDLEHYVGDLRPYKREVMP